MSPRPKDDLTTQLRRVRSQLSDCLAGECGSEDLQRLARDLAALEGLARGRRRRRSLFWGVSVIASVVSAALFLTFPRLREADVGVVASTRAFVVESGGDTSNVLRDAVDLTEWSVSSAIDEPCLTVQSPTRNECLPTAALKLNTLVINSRSTVMLRSDAECFDLYVFAGGASASITLRSAEAREPPVTPRWEVRHATLSAGESIHACADAEAILNMNGVTTAVLGYRNPGGVAEREDSPSLLNGTLSIPAASRSIDLQRTDVVRLSDLSDSSLIARLGHALDLSLVARAGKAAIATGGAGTSRDCMPTWLERLSNSQGLRLVFALLAAIVAPVLALRERVLAEL